MSETKKRNRHRRGNGEGSVFQRKDGRWAATITAGHTETGKRKRRTVYAATKREVLDKLSELSHQNRTGTLAEPTTSTVAEYMRHWLENSAKPTIRASTYRSYERTIRTNVSPIIGGVRLSKLRATHIQSLYAALQERGLAAGTIRTACAVLKRALSDAERFNLIASNPARLVKPPKLEHREMQVLTAEQVRAFLSEAKGDRCWPLFVVAVHSGMRQAELLGLEWPDVDFARQTITVSRTASYVGSKLVVDAPKTRKSLRTIDASAAVLDALNVQRAMLLREGQASCRLIFPSQQGTVQHRSNITRRHFAPTLKAAELPNIRFHDLRHTAASLMLQSGVNAKIVAERLGHATVNITLGIYAHVMPGMGRDASDRLDALLSEPIGCQLAVNQA